MLDTQTYNHRQFAIVGYSYPTEVGIWGRGATMTMGWVEIFENQHNLEPAVSLPRPINGSSNSHPMIGRENLSPLSVPPPVQEATPSTVSGTIPDMNLNALASRIRRRTLDVNPVSQSVHNSDGDHSTLLPEYREFPTLPPAYEELIDERLPQVARQTGE